MKQTENLTKAEKAKIKDSKLTLTLSAKSGYSSVETHKISLNQWVSINKILNK